ncbi:Cholesterol oxidase [Lachnellula arida]|uniref:Cholesterol oxidase n=1 Tax=Lachnellula arida TaxID=1316785 RepID=A0A8T9BE49_9HELO|nr:Cholesterol oxidase [Lachnellula arida]
MSATQHRWDTTDSARTSEEMQSGSDLESDSLSTTPSNFDEFHRWQAHIALKNFGEGLHAAAQAVFPSERRFPYSKVYVLMLCWDDERANQRLDKDMDQLSNVFKDVYHFETEVWRIPDEDSNLDVNQKVLDFVDLGGDRFEDLKIVYYTGKARLDKNEKLVWTSGRKNSRSRYPTVRWSGIQTALEQSQSDVLTLLDCCHAGTASSDEGNGTTELIAACAYNSSTHGVPSYSFTKELEIELRELSTLSSFSVGNLYDNLFSRVRSRMSEEGLEHQSPVYLPLTQENPKSPRSIRLSVHNDGNLPNQLASGGSYDVQSPLSDIFGITNGDPTGPAFKPSSATAVGPTPRMAFAIRLTEDFRVGDLSSNLFYEWLRNIPASVDQVKIEAAFHSYSSLLIVSVPICLSIYIPKDPAVMSLGPITSFNQVLSRVLIPKDLPTPNPDIWTWDHLGNGINGLHSNAKTNEVVTGLHGNVNSQPSEIRLRKNAHLIPLKGQKEFRPKLETSYSSRFSAASSMTEEPLSSNETNDSAKSPISPEDLHRSYPHGPYARESHTCNDKTHPEAEKYAEDENGKEFPRISKPVELMWNSYDCVVIGSGYGGAVAASRMARAGQEVCLLERGQERWPGEYPTGFMDVMEQFHVSGEFAPGFLRDSIVEGGDPTGLYHLIVGKGQNAFVGNGLGGTSLLNANVFLEANDSTMRLDSWPEELQGYDKLKKYYKRAASVLQPEPYPKNWPELPKLKMLEKQAKALGLEEKFRRVPQTTRFRDGPNSTGVEMFTSQLTGMDSTGINDGSKSSTLVNYLSDAWNWGAEMFCECEVRYITKHPEEGYLVFYAWHGSKRGAFPTNLYEDLMWVHAKKCVFLGAGSIGTTEILLRSKNLGLPMSDRVGQGMSGNGDILAFGYNTDDEVNAIGREGASPYHPVGPTITGIIDNREDHENALDGYVIEEGAIPQALAELFQTMLELMPGNQYPKGHSLFGKVKHALAQQGSRFLGPYYKKGSIERTQVYLIMSHDSNQAIMTLKDDKPILEFLGVGNSSHVKFLNGLLEQATEAVGGTYVQSPFSAYLGQEITVHPIGGACFAKDGTADTGVTNHFGEVLTGNGDETHHGLIVMDAAVIPTALGVNPFATITALAERSVEHAARSIGQRIDLKTKNNDVLDLFGEPHQHAEAKQQLDRRNTIRIAAAIELVDETRASKANGFGFSEVMSGYIHIGDGIQGEKIENYETAAKTARGLCEEARFFLSVQAWDTDMTVYRADHKAMLTGTFTCGSLPGSPFLVQRGDFHLFSVDTSAPGTRNLTYDFNMTSVDGTEFHFHGYKVVDSSITLAPWRFWSAASTLYVTISHATGDKAIVGRGMMHIKPSDFFSEVFTLKPSGRNFLAKVQSTANFMGFFARQSANLFLAPFVWQQYPSVNYDHYINGTPPDDVIEIFASDGVQTLLKVFEPRNPNIKTKNLFMIPGASVDEQIFSTPTIEVNAINYFTRAGYRVFVTVHRICNLMVAKNGWTTFDSRLDIKACLEQIRKDQGPEKIYTICHCMGAVSFSSGLLDGTIPADWILGISASQVFCNPIWAALNMAKVSAGPVPFDKLYSMFGGSWFDCSSSRNDTYFQQLLNQLLRLYPDERKEICNNVACHRGSLVYGRMWNHRNLNEATHRQINRFFGGVNMTCLHLLMHMGYRGFVTTNGPLFNDLTTPRNVHRLKDIPIMLFSGSDNQVLTPEATEKTYGLLRDTFGAKGYERHVIQGYGHLDCWMGREAYKDVYPMVRESVDRATRGKGYKYHEPDWKNDWKGWENLEISENLENEG